MTARTLRVVRTYSNGAEQLRDKPLDVTPAPNGGTTPKFQGHQPGKIYFGMSTDTSYDTEVARVGGPVGCEPIFQPNYVTKVTTDLQAKRLPWISTKPDDLGASQGTAGWSQIANASSTSTIANTTRSLFRSLQGISSPGPVVYTFHHEPMGDANGNATLAAAWVGAWMNIISWVEEDAQIGGLGSRGRFLFAPNMEEFVFRTNPEWLNMFHPASLMSRFDFYGFDAYQYDAGTPAVLFSNRFPAVRSYVQGIRPGIMFGIREHGARNSFKTANSTRPSAAVFLRDMANYVFAHPEWFWLASYFNAVGVNNSRLDQPKMAGDTESILDIYKEKRPQGVVLP